MIKTFIKILEFNFCNSIINNSKQNKISEGIAKEIHIWNRMRLSLRGKSIIDNKTLSSKLWHIGQFCAIPKYTKKEYTISYRTGRKYNLPGTYNHFHNILELFDVLPNFPFNISLTMRDYYLKR